MAEIYISHDIVIVFLKFDQLFKELSLLQSSYFI